MESTFRSHAAASIFCSVRCHHGRPDAYSPLLPACLLLVCGVFPLCAADSSAVSRGGALWEDARLMLSLYFVSTDCVMCSFSSGQSSPRGGQRRQPGHSSICESTVCHVYVGVRYLLSYPESPVWTSVTCTAAHPNKWKPFMIQPANEALIGCNPDVRDNSVPPWFPWSLVTSRSTRRPSVD